MDTEQYKANKAQKDDVQSLIHTFIDGDDKRIGLINALMSQVIEVKTGRRDRVNTRDLVLLYANNNT
uniref:Uncharacterized protein n=1 Tax=Pithovirus LCPAC101 TaxID=2506586 RepID=A0A481Z4N0_9VIRU|nr:MAG: hypothetical protein LCPAC101_02520 [Pithovirus LCPAC101]